MSNTCTWLSYEFTVYPANAEWNAVGGVYIFTGLTPQNQWRPYYMGQAESFQDRLPNHERWAEAARLGATHVHVRVVQQEATRQAVEQELIQRFQPPLNSQLR